MHLALIAIAACAGGIFVATPDGSGLAQPLDDLVANTVGAAHPAVVVAILRGATLLDSLAGAVVTALVGIAAIGRRPGRKRLAGLVATSAGAAIVVVVLAQQIVARPAPRARSAGVATSLSSFPGAGVAVATAMAAATLSMIRHRAPGGRRRAGFVALIATAAVALSGVVVGRHWLSDELAAALIGMSIGRVIARGAAPSSQRLATRRLAPRTLARCGMAIAFITIPPSVISYWHALDAPGYAATDARTVDWLRTHGLGSFVDRAESWWLWTHLPSTTDQITSLPAEPIPITTNSTGDPAHSDHVGARTASASSTNPPTDVPHAVAALIEPALPMEGRWSVAMADANGRTEIATTSIRPDPAHPALVSTLAWMNSATVRFSLVAGTQQPAGHPGPWNATVPDQLRSTLLAAFNSGYRMQDTPGGAIVERLHVRQLQPGLASLVIRADGSATVGNWGRDLSSTADVVAVRQNLHLIVVAGQLVPGLRTNVGQMWGTVKNALPTWRSGIGVDRSGNLVYASGNELTIDTLATALRRGGAVTAMELDIHRHMVTYNLFTPDPVTSQLVGHKLSPDMTEPATRYLHPDQRDFIAVFGRQGAN